MIGILPEITDKITKDCVAIIFCCESNIQGPGNESIKTNNLISEYFHKA